MNTKSTASCGCGKPRTTPISPEEKRWLREQLYQSHYDECMQERHGCFFGPVIKRTINRRFVFYGASIAFVLPQRQLVRGNP